MGTTGGGKEHTYKPVVLRLYKLQNHLQDFLKYKVLGPTPEILIKRSGVGGGPGICISNKFIN